MVTQARENYQYLTMNHVTEDIIYFVDYFNEYDEKGAKRPKPLNRPVILFGASYGGTLAVYTKYKFNDKIAG